MPQPSSIQQPQPEPSENQATVPKRFPTSLILSVVAVIGYILAGVFLTKNTSLSKNLKSLQGEVDVTKTALNSEKQKTNDLDKELIYYKNTDLSKEVELLTLKLENTERELGSTQRDLSSTQAQLKNLQSNNTKIKPYLDAINAIEAMLSEGPKASNVANVDSKVSALGDSEVSSQWNRAKVNIDVAKSSWSGSDVSATVTLITSRILSLTQ